jgi:2-hydroxy-3-keto-5-methylthiopentenyl-1-phosphate phosphatase
MKIPLLQKANEIINGTATAPVEIFCDFDGTISTCDVTDRLLEELADPKWKAVETAWENGEIGSRECMAQQVALIRGGWKAMQRVLDSMRLEDSFKPFVKWCKDQHIQLHIVSDGLDKVIEYLLERNGIKISSVVANHLVECADGSMSLQFPYSIPDKFCTSGVCKCKVLSDAKLGTPISAGSIVASNLLSRVGLLPRSQSVTNDGQSKTMKIVIGDGRSDFCWANEADLVFAKSQLLEYCKEKRLHYMALEDFSGVANYIKTHLLAEPTPAAVSAEQMSDLPNFGLQSIA